MIACGEIQAADTNADQITGSETSANNAEDDEEAVDGGTPADYADDDDGIVGAEAPADNDASDDGSRVVSNRIPVQCIDVQKGSFVSSGYKYSFFTLEVNHHHHHNHNLKFFTFSLSH